MSTTKPAQETCAMPVTSAELWALRQKVLGAGMGDPWDGEELENGYVRPIPEGFEREVARFDAMHSQEIKNINECLEVISGLAMRLQSQEQSANSHASLVARCARLEKALEEIVNCAENHLAARSLPFPPLIHVEGLTGGVEKINAMARAALQGAK